MKKKKKKKKIFYFVINNCLNLRTVFYFQWIIVMFFLVLANGIYLLCMKYLRHYFVDDEENIIFQPEEIYRKYSTNIFHENEEIKKVLAESKN